MLKAERRLKLILKKSKMAGINPDSLINFKVFHDMNSDCKLIPGVNYKTSILKLTIALFIFLFWQNVTFDQKTQCSVEMPIDTSKVFRKSEDCSMCDGVTDVLRVKNISQMLFENLYAHTGKPVVISDGAVKWQAMRAFNFEFFKKIYDHNNDNTNDIVDECQFFPYKTEFKSLSEVFNMSKERSQLEPGSQPWYVGWSNCNDEAGKILRQYYSQPYFLPENSENIALSWIFMGGPGNGAHMHVDNVIHPSWQAQIRGKKLWKLMPPPECIYHCSAVSVIVHPGEIIIVDTNKWYHQTTILEGEVSITIGSEFD